MVEAVGSDMGSNVVAVNHVDVFEGTDRTLVSPTFNSLLANNAMVTTIDPSFNRVMNAWDYAGQSMLYGWAYPISNGSNGIPSRLHLVGSVVERVPLRLAVPGNNVATVIPSNSNSFSVSQVTRGAMNYARKGDYAFLLPSAINTRGLAVSQLILYKSISFQQFNPAGRQIQPR